VYGAPANNNTCSSQTFLVGGDVPVKRIINGLWQSSGGWGPAVDNTDAVDAMLEMHARGFTIFDGLLYVRIHGAWCFINGGASIVY
jgi:hypothetical protein